MNSRDDNFEPDANVVKTISLTRITSQRPPRLSKGFRLTKDGTLEKLPGGAMSAGTAERLSLSGVGELAEILTSLSPAQALCYGIAQYEEARVIAKEALEFFSQNGGPPTIARTREHFQFPAGIGILMLDSDPGIGASTLERG